MHLRILGTAVLLPAALLASAAQAQSVEPGLWEMKSRMQMPGLQAQLKDMPPEVRKMMEQQMGIGLGAGDDGLPAVRLCLTPADVREGPIREGQREGDCTYTQVSRSDKLWKGRLVCANPPSQGEFTVTLHSPQHYTSHAVMQSQGKGGGRTEMEVEARRLSGDCGSLAAGAAQRSKKQR